MGSGSGVQVKPEGQRPAVQLTGLGTPLQVPAAARTHELPESPQSAVHVQPWPLQVQLEGWQVLGSESFTQS